jgi:hypothetical protein
MSRRSGGSSTTGRSRISSAFDRALKFIGDELRIEVEHLPAAGTVQRYAIVHFSRVDHNDLPGRGVNLAKMAPRALRAANENTEAKLLVGMARKVLFRQQRHGLETGERQVMLLDVMDAGAMCSSRSGSVRV